MAPVTRHHAKLREQKRKRRSDFMSFVEAKKYSRFQYVYCPLHINQLKLKDGIITDIRTPDHLQNYDDESSTRVLNFKVFDRQVLSQNCNEGNIALIIDLEWLLDNFDRLYCGIDPSSIYGNNDKQCVFVSKNEHQNLAEFDHSKENSLWYQEQDGSNYVLHSPNSNGLFETGLQFQLEVDIARDIDWLNKWWLKECLDHQTCSSHGVFCHSLFDKNTAREIYYNVS